MTIHQRVSDLRSRLTLSVLFRHRASFFRLAVDPSTEARALYVHRILERLNETLDAVRLRQSSVGRFRSPPLDRSRVHRWSARGAVLPGRVLAADRERSGGAGGGSPTLDAPRATLRRRSLLGGPGGGARV